MIIFQIILFPQLRYNYNFQCQMFQHLYIFFVILFSLIVLFDLLYYGILFRRFAFHKKKKSKKYNLKPISIVIATKNDAHHLMKSLPLILTQEYDDYEVIVVDDKSDDETMLLVEDFKSLYPHLKYVDLNLSITNIKGKKFPISMGIKVAKNEIIVLIEPDCIPLSSLWLQNISQHFIFPTEIVLGYASIEKRKGLFNALMRYDGLFTAMQYFSYALAKIPFMGTGKNLAYTKTLFMKNRGFASHYHILYGEDNLFINHVATKKNCEIEYGDSSTVLSLPFMSFSRWFRYKKQYKTTQKYYHKKHKFLLHFHESLSPFFYLFLILSLITIPFQLSLWSILLFSFFLLRIGSQYYILGLSAKKLGEQSLIPFFLFYDFLFALLNPFIYMISKMSKNPDKLWK